MPRTTRLQVPRDELVWSHSQKHVLVHYTPNVQHQEKGKMLNLLNAS
jgi:hypothetical protein